MLSLMSAHKNANLMEKTNSGRKLIGTLIMIMAKYRET